LLHGWEYQAMPLLRDGAGQEEDQWSLPKGLAANTQG
jgi:hypothetical protein